MAAVPLQIKDCEASYRVTDDDSDTVLRFEDSGTVSIPSDDAQDLPLGFQFAVESFNGTVVLRNDSGVVVAGADRMYVGPLKTGVFVKQNANFWLLSLGQGSGGGGGGGEGTPSRPYPSFDATYSALTWVPVTGTAGPTLGYGVSVVPEGAALYSLSGTTLNLNYVLSGIPVSFEVWGVNVAGKGVVSDPAVHTWDAIPATTLTVESGPASAVLSWSAVGQATGYVVQYKKSADTDWQTLPTAKVTTYTVQGLNEQVSWDFRVAGTVAPAASAWSNVVSVTPGPGVVDKPAASHTGNQQFTITNYDDALIYTVYAVTVGGSVAAGKVTLSGKGVAKLGCKRSAGAPEEFVWLESRTITTHPECSPQSCYDPCGNCRTDVNPHTWGCGCGSGCGEDGQGQWGDCICHGPNVCNDVEDATPPGYGKDSGEWWRISDTALTMSAQVPVQGVTVKDGVLEGWISAPWAHTADGQLVLEMGSSLLRVFDGAGKTLGYWAYEIDQGFTYTSFDRVNWWMRLLVPGVVLPEGVNPATLGWQFVGWTPHGTGDVDPEPLAMISGKVVVS